MSTPTMRRAPSTKPGAPAIKRTPSDAASPAVPTPSLQRSASVLSTAPLSPPMLGSPTSAGHKKPALPVVNGYLNRSTVVYLLACMDDMPDAKIKMLIARAIAQGVSPDVLFVQSNKQIPVTVSRLFMSELEEGGLLCTLRDLPALPAVLSPPSHTSSSSAFSSAILSASTNVSMSNTKNKDAYMVPSSNPDAAVVDMVRQLVLHEDSLIGQRWGVVAEWNVCRHIATALRDLDVCISLPEPDRIPPPTAEFSSPTLPLSHTRAPDPLLPFQFGSSMAEILILQSITRPPLYRVPNSAAEGSNSSTVTSPGTGAAFSRQPSLISRQPSMLSRQSSALSTMTRQSSSQSLIAPTLASSSMINTGGNVFVRHSRTFTATVTAKSYELLLIPAGDFDMESKQVSKSSQESLQAIYDAVCQDRQVSFDSEGGPRLILVDSHIASQATAFFFVQNTSALMHFKDIKCSDPLALVKTITDQPPGRQLVIIAPHALLVRTAAFLLHRDVNYRLPAFSPKAWLLLRYYDAPLEPVFLARQLNCWTVAEPPKDTSTSKNNASASRAQDEEMERERLAMRAEMRKSIVK